VGVGVKRDPDRGMSQPFGDDPWDAHRETQMASTVMFA
jgi:hypothetical protein